MQIYDVIVIGGGPGGLAAGAAAKKQGAERVLIIERENTLGGVLNQCIHDGFGLVRYHQQLTGPEYAKHTIDEAVGCGAEIKIGCMVTAVAYDAAVKYVTVLSRDGVQILPCKTIIFATGCRERTRGAISIPGSRPAGVFQAGVAQHFVNRQGIMIGRRIVILGSGDIGLIMARRLTLEGAKVLAVVEVMPQPSGLSRNITQCLYDFNIPLYLRHTVSNIIGKNRVETVEISRVGDDGQVIPDTSWQIECDTLILSVGLIPENEVAGRFGVRLDPKTNGVLTDQFLQTNLPGVFSCGNSRRVMDLADFVSAQGETAGKNAVLYLQRQPLCIWNDDQGCKMARGLPDPNSVTCTLCPNGCQIQIRKDGQTEGNLCKRGHQFALQEQNDPERILTTTICVSGTMVPVRSDHPVKKNELQVLIDNIHRQRYTLPIHAGQSLLQGVGRNGVNIIAQQTVAL